MIRRDDSMALTKMSSKAGKQYPHDLCGTVECSTCSGQTLEKFEIKTAIYTMAELETL